MTQPIQEPSPARTDSGLEWGKRQLFRRPAPVNAGLPFPWAILHDGSVDVTAATSPMPVDFDVATKNPATDDFFTWTTTDAGDSGNFRFVLKLIQEGLYLLDLVGSWTDTGSDVGTAMLDINPSNSYNPFGVNDEKFVTQIGGDWGVGQDIQASSVQRVFCLYSANANCTLEPTVTLTGITVTKTFETSYMKALLLEAHGDTDNWAVDYVGT